MGISHLLEDFAAPRATEGELLSDVMVEDLRLEAFERGYQAGWDDSAKAQQDGATAISEDFARNIRDLSFTYHEAYSSLVSAMEPLIRQIVTSVLPELAQGSLAARVAGLLQAEIAAHGKQPVLLTTAPASAEALRTILPEGGSLPVEIRQDGDLAPGQVHLRIGDVAEHEIDLEEVLDGIGAAIDGFFRDATQSLRETA